MREPRENVVSIISRVTATVLVRSRTEQNNESTENVENRIIKADSRTHQDGLERRSWDLKSVQCGFESHRPY
jgi:hypothetical protein